MDNLTRSVMTLGCRDCDHLPKVADAGRIRQEGDETIQVMHNGVKVVAGGYHGDWMAQIIRGLRGHHEPQEELAFASILKFARHRSVICELGAFWSYYSLWFLHEIPGARAVCVEPDPANVDIGRRNAALNGFARSMTFVEGWVGDRAESAAHVLESTGLPRSLPSLDMEAVAELAGSDIEVLHIDAQGAELPFIRSMATAVRRGSVRFLVASTHHRLISGSKTTHDDCLAAVRDIGGRVLVEHSVQESFSGDGLIVASFLPQDRYLALPEISRNTPSRSLFPEP